MPASQNNTVLVGGSIGALTPKITDSQGNVWTITPSGQVAINGVVDPQTARVIALVYENGVIWQENADRLWWSKTSAASPIWSPGPGTPVSPIMLGAAIPGITYLDGSVVYYAEAVTPVGYSVTTVADGDRGIIFNYTGFTNTNNGAIHNTMGTLSLNVHGTLTNNSPGTITTQAGIGNATTTVFVGYNEKFFNSGNMTVAGGASGGTHGTLWIEMTTGGAAFKNDGFLTASGAGQTINIWSSSHTQFDNVAVNNDVIMAQGGAGIYITAPLMTSTGYGVVEAINHSFIKLSGSVGAGEFIYLDNSNLEFGPASYLGNPAMQFAGTIEGTNGNLAGSAVLLDGVLAASIAFKVTSSGGAGLAELQVFDVSHIMIADLHFLGHFQQSDFSLHPMAGTPAGNYSYITMASPHAFASNVLHS